MQLNRLIEDAGRTSPLEAVRTWQKLEDGLPGFGHRLYPNGDIRALELGRRHASDALMRQLEACVLDEIGARPNLDFALVAIARGLNLPADAPFTLFLLGRTVNWATHAMEQVLDGKLIRPRARYEGRDLLVSLQQDAAAVGPSISGQEGYRSG